MSPTVGKNSSTALRVSGSLLIVVLIEVLEKGKLPFDNLDNSTAFTIWSAWTCAFLTFALSLALERLANIIDANRAKIAITTN